MKSRLLGVVCACVIALGFVSTTYAALVTHIDGLDINGTLYDVTFHTGASFHDLWDADADQTFGDNDGSVFNAAPTFWNTPSGAQSAASAIVAYLALTDTTNQYGSDSFYIPYQYDNTSGVTLVRVYYDSDPYVGNDSWSNVLAAPNGGYIQNPYVSFVEAVPVPAAAWLFGSGLLGLAGMARRKTIKSQ